MELIIEHSPTVKSIKEIKKPALILAITMALNKTTSAKKNHFPPIHGGVGSVSDPNTTISPISEAGFSVTHQEM